MVGGLLKLGSWAGNSGTHPIRLGISASVRVLTWQRNASITAVYLPVTFLKWGRKDPAGAPCHPIPAVSSRVQSSSTHTSVLCEEDRLSAHSYAWGAIFSTLYRYFFNKAREASAFLLFNMSVLPFKYGPEYHHPCRNPVFSF